MASKSDRDVIMEGEERSGGDDEEMEVRPHHPPERLTSEFLYKSNRAFVNGECQMEKAVFMEEKKKTRKMTTKATKKHHAQEDQ